MPGKPERVREVVFSYEGVERARVKLCDCPLSCAIVRDVIAEYPDGQQEKVDAFNFHGELVGEPPEWMLPVAGVFRNQPYCDLACILENGLELCSVIIVTWSIFSDEERTVRGVFPIRGVFAGHCRTPTSAASA